MVKKIQSITKNAQQLSLHVDQLLLILIFYYNCRRGNLNSDLIFSQLIIQYQMPSLKIIAIIFLITLSSAQVKSSSQNKSSPNKKIGDPCLNADFNCNKNPGAYFNPTTCQCECNNVCDCQNSLQSWVGYPTCGCLCPQQPNCNQNQIWFSPTCSCICKNSVSCPNPKHVQDPLTCECACSTTTCRNPAQIQDPNTCECNCKKSDCPPGFSQDPNTCQCIRSQCPPLICPDIQIQCTIAPCPIRKQRVNTVTCTCESLGLF